MKPVSIANGPSLLFALAVTALTGMLTSIAPALRYSGAALARGLREGPPATTGSSSRLRARGVLVAAEVALSAGGDLTDLMPNFDGHVRHASFPFFTPEPDIIHELRGHAPMFLHPPYATLSGVIGGHSRPPPGGCGHSSWLSDSNP